MDVIHVTFIKDFKAVIWLSMVSLLFCFSWFWFTDVLHFRICSHGGTFELLRSVY